MDCFLLHKAPNQQQEEDYVYQKANKVGREDGEATLLCYLWSYLRREIQHWFSKVGVC